MKMLTRQELNTFLDGFLFPANYTDYCPNGLQIEGQEKISKIAFAVSATVDSIERTVREGCQALIVHHGLFWKFHGVRPLTGPHARRIFPLVKNDINLFGFHLPLDAHMEVGHAATIARKLSMERVNSLSDAKGMGLGIYGKLARPMLPAELQECLKGLLRHEVVMSSYDLKAPIKSLGIITGRANAEWVLAKAKGLDAYLTGEMSEHDWHEAQEAGMHMFAGGHNATEEWGLLALMEKIQKEFTGYELQCQFFPSANPV